MILIGLPIGLYGYTKLALAGFVGFNAIGSLLAMATYIFFGQ